MNRFAREISMALVMSTLLPGYVSPLFAHDGAHGPQNGEQQQPATEPSQTPQQSEAENFVNPENSTTISTSASPQESFSQFPTGEAILTLLVATPLLLMWVKRRLQR